jgi:hypothetical protein
MKAAPLVAGGKEDNLLGMCAHMLAEILFLKKLYRNGTYRFKLLPVG